MQGQLIFSMAQSYLQDTKVQQSQTKEYVIRNINKSEYLKHNYLENNLRIPKKRIIFLVLIDLKWRKETNKQDHEKIQAAKWPMIP